MNIARRVFKNTIALIAAESIGKVSYFVLFLVLSYKFTPSLLGGYVTLAAFVYLASSLTDVGISYVLVRELAADRSAAQRLFSQGLTVALALTLAACLILVAIAEFGKYSHELRPLIALTGFAVAGNSMMQLGFSIFRAYEHMEIQAMISGSMLLITSAVGVGLAMGGLGLPAQVANLISWPAAGAGVTLWIVHKRFIHLSLNFDLRACGALLLKALPMGLLIWCVIFLQFFDLLVLGHFQPMSDVAVYAIACKIFDGAGMVIASGIIALTPVMSMRWTQSVGKARILYQTSLRPFVALGIGGTIGLGILADSIVTTLFGTTYLAAAVPLRLMSLSFALIAIGAPVVVLLLSVDGLLGRFLPSVSLILISNVIFNLALAPLFGYKGSAVSFLLTVSVALVVCRRVAAVCLRAQIITEAVMLIKPLFAGLVMAGGLLIINDESIFLSIPTGLAIYIVSLTLMGEFRQDPYSTLWAKAKTVVTTGV